MTDPSYYVETRWGGSEDAPTKELNKVRSALGAYKVLVIKHWHYRGSRAPDLVVVEDFGDFLNYLREKAMAGDAIDVYDVTEALTDTRRVASGKCPDQNGNVPRGGAY